MPANVPPSRTLHARPDLDQLKRQAKELLDAFRAREPDSVAEVRAHYRDANAESFALHDAQLVIARSYGFTSWPKLKAHVDGVTLRRTADAVRTGDLAQVRAMLERRPELVHIDMAEHDEHRLLHFAVLARNADMVRLLMRFGADARKGIYPHRDATSALTIASDRGYDEIVTIIREAEAVRGSSPARVDESPWTPLHVAAGGLDRNGVRRLLAAGADPNARGDAGRTPIDVAVELHRMPEGNGPRWTTRLVEYVARRRFRAIAADLLRQGAELSPAAAVALGDAEWLRAYHAKHGLATAVRYGVAEQTTGLLTLAVKHERPRILALLLELGLDPNERTRMEDVDDVVYTAGMPLHYCASHGKLEMATMLVEAGADPNAQVYAAGSSMHRAYSRRDMAMVELLSKHGGVVDAITVGSLREVDKARQMLDDEAAGRLPKEAKVGMVGEGSVAQDLLWAASGAGSVEIVRMCLERIDWSRTEPRWYAMLREPMYIGMHRTKAEREELIECFRLMLERCDPVALTDNRDRGWLVGRSLLHDLSGTRHRMPAEDQCTLASMLLDAGMRVDARDDLLKSTPLGWACRWGHVELVRLLMSRGADPIEADAEPWATPRAWATKHGHEAVLRALDGR